MIQDLEDFATGEAFRADVCIVGGGVAGITLALTLSEAGQGVLLLESGGERLEPDTQSLYDGQVTDDALHAPAITYRQRRLGGTSGIWGGRCVPYDASDFEHRPWINESGWPIPFASLLPFYAAANRLCEAGHFAYTAKQAFPQGDPAIIGGFQGSYFSDDTLERFSCPTDFGVRYRNRLVNNRNIRVLLHANVTEIVTTWSGAVDHLTVKTLTGKSFTAAARRYVLATGGLETPRLLLASRGRHADGIGNGYDWVGRSYMAHIAGTIGALTGAPGRVIHHGYTVSQEGIYCRRRFALKAAAQRRMAVGNFVGRLHHPRIPDPAHRTGFLSALFLMKPFISYEYRKRLHGDAALTPSAKLRHLGNIARDPFDTAGLLVNWLRKRTLAVRKFPSIIVRPKSGVYSLDFNAEQEPNRNSRVSLTDVRDRLGMQRILIDWRHTVGDMQTVRKALHALAADLQSSRSGQFVFDDAEVEFSALRDGAYGGHHVGTTRMAASPRNGVVDSNGRVFDTPNLYIAGSAVFPTSSQANPTLTIVAMSLRLAKHLEHQALRDGVTSIRSAHRSTDHAATSI